MSIQVSYPKQAILLLMLLVVIFLVIEGIARIYDYYYPDCNLIQNELFNNESHDLKKKICDGFQDRRWYIDPVIGMPTLKPNQESPTIHINSHGFRGNEITQEKPYDVFRIFMVGGSTTFAPRAPSDELSIPGYLQTEFSESDLGMEVEMINAGIPNLASTGELLLIQKKIINFDPDLIIIYDGYNDLYLRLGFVKDLPPNEELEKNNFNQDIKKYFKTPYFVSSYFANFENFSIMKSMDVDSDFKRPREITDVDQKAERWAENISKVCEIGNENGFKTIVFLQPFLGTGNKTFTEHEMNISMKVWDSKKAAFEYQKFVDLLEELELKCTKVADFRNIFDDVNESVYFDNAHIHYKFNKYVAEKIFDTIKNNSTIFQFVLYYR